MRRQFRAPSIVLAVIAVAATSVPVSAQHLGGRIGLVISDQMEGPDAIKHLTLGLLADLPLGHGRFVPSASLIPKGSQYATSFVEPTPQGGRLVVASGDPWYISVQGDLQWPFPLGSANFYVLVAPRVDFLLAVDQGSYAYAEGLPVRVDDPPYNTVVWGGAIGIGQDIRMSNHTLFLELRYDRDLSSAMDLPGGAYGYGYTSLFGYGTESVFNRAFMVQLGFRWGTPRSEHRPTPDQLWPPVNPRY